MNWNAQLTALNVIQTEYALTMVYQNVTYITAKVGFVPETFVHSVRMDIMCLRRFAINARNTAPNVRVRPHVRNALEENTDISVIQSAVPLAKTVLIQLIVLTVYLEDTD